MTTTLPFSGSDYVEERDHDRLTGQILRIYELMKDGTQRSLRTISEATGDPEASTSAQLRNLRKRAFGAHDVRKRYAGGGLYLYWIQGVAE